MSDSERQQKMPGAHLSDDTLNELVQQSLSSEGRSIAEAHLSGCSDCTDRLNSLVATLRLLRSAPEIRPTRSFQLAPEQAHRRNWIDRVGWRLLPSVPVLRAATLAVLLLFVGVSVTDFAVNRDGNETSPVQSTFRGAPAARENVATSPPLVMQESEAGDFAPLPDSDAAPIEGASISLTEIPAGAPGNGGQAPLPAGGAASAGETGGIGAASSVEIAPSVVQTFEPATPSPVAIPVSEETQSTRDVSNWRIAEIALLVVFAWLLVTWIGRLRTDRSRPEGFD